MKIFRFGRCLRLGEIFTSMKTVLWSAGSETVELYDSFPDRDVEVICCDIICVFSGFIVDTVYLCFVAMKALQFTIE